MISFSDIVEIQGQNKNVTQKIISDRKELSETRNDTEKEYASVKDPLNLQRTSSNETTLVSETPSIINEQNVIIAPGQGKKQFQF